MKVKIDFVSDVSCPWCIIGLRSLEEALARTSDVVDADLAFHPFELNPSMPEEGQNIVEHIAQKYGSSPDQAAASRDMIKARAAELGFTINTSDESRIYNTFDAHRLLHWARLNGRQRELKQALFEANFTNGQDPSDHKVLVAAAAAVGLEENGAEEVLKSARYDQEVREAERAWQSKRQDPATHRQSNDTGGLCRSARPTPANPCYRGGRPEQQPASRNRGRSACSTRRAAKPAPSPRGSNADVRRYATGEPAAFTARRVDQAGNRARLTGRTGTVPGHR